jgi:hypothetical protein
MRTNGRAEYRVVNLPAWPGAAERRPPPWHNSDRRLRDRLTVHVAAVAELGVLPERLAFVAVMLTLGTQILKVRIGVGDGASAETYWSLRAWAARHPIDTPIGPQWLTLSPWRDVMRDGVHRDGYLARRPIIAADALRTFGLCADRQWRPSRRHAEFRNGFGLGLGGIGRVLIRADGRARWSNDFGSAPLYVTGRAAHASHCAWGAPRSYVCSDPETGERVEERRGVWDGDTPYPGEFVDLLGVASTLDAVDSHDLAEHLVEFDIDPIAPRPVAVNAHGLAHVVVLVRAQHRLLLALDDEAGAWLDDLDPTHLWSAGTLASEVLSRMGVGAPSLDGLDDTELDQWRGCAHGGWTESTPTTEPVTAADADERSSYPVSMEAIGWWRFVIAERFTVDHPLDEALAWAAQIAQAAAGHDFEAVKRLASDLVMTRWFGCWRVVLRADEPPNPLLAVELREQAGLDDAGRRWRMSGRLVMRPIMTVGGLVWDCTGDGYLLAVATASAIERHPCVFDVVDVARVVPHGQRPTTAVRVLDMQIDGDPVPALVAQRARCKAETAKLQRRAARLRPGDARRAALERRAHQGRRRAAVLRVLVNALYGHTARYDAGGPYGFKPGPRAFPPLAAMITAASRRRIGLAKCHAEARGAVALAIDTDGILFPVSADGGEPVETLDGRRYRALSYAEHAEVLSGFEHVALDDRGLWDIARDHDGRPLRARAFGPKRYGIGVSDG